MELDKPAGSGIEEPEEEFDFGAQLGIQLLPEEIDLIRSAVVAYMKSMDLQTARFVENPADSLAAFVLQGKGVLRGIGEGVLAKVGGGVKAELPASPPPKEIPKISEAQVKFLHVRMKQDFKLFSEKGKLEKLSQILQRVVHSMADINMEEIRDVIAECDRARDARVGEAVTRASSRREPDPDSDVPF